MWWSGQNVNHKTGSLVAPMYSLPIFPRPDWFIFWNLMIFNCTPELFLILKVFKVTQFILKTTVLGVSRKIYICIIKNYLLKWGWPVVDIYWVMKWWGKYLTLTTNMEVNICFWWKLKQWDNITQKDDFDSFNPATVKIFSGANPVWVAWRWIAKDIWSLSSQSENTFNAIRCLSIYQWYIVLSPDKEEILTLCTQLPTHLGDKLLIGRLFLVHWLSC